MVPSGMSKGENERESSVPGPRRRLSRTRWPQGLRPFETRGLGSRWSLEPMLLGSTIGAPTWNGRPTSSSGTTQGIVHPDTYWSDYALDSVRNRPFSEIWEDLSDPVLDGLRHRPRPLKGRCGACAYKSVCGGNTRIRALQLTGDPWEADPACYLSDEEIGLETGVPVGSRPALTPFRGVRHDPTHRFL